MIKLMVNVSSILLLVVGGPWIAVTLHKESYTFCLGWPLPIPTTIINRRSRGKVAHKTATSTSVIWSGTTSDSNSDSSSSSTATDNYSGGSASGLSKQRLFQLLDGTPPNEPTPPSLTLQILDEIRRLEKESSVVTVKDSNEFLSSLAGNWDLIWTAQDVNSQEYRNANPIRRWIK